MSAAQGVSEAIATLLVPGVTIKAFGQAPDSINDRDTPILIPNPDGWYEESAVPEPLSTGNAGTAFMISDFTLHYLFLFAPAGQGRGVQEMQETAQAKLEGLFNAIITADYDTTLGVVWIAPAIDGAFGSITESVSARSFYGAGVDVAVKQYLNAG